MAESPRYRDVLELAGSPHAHARCEAAEQAWHLGTVAEPLLIRLLGDEGSMPDNDVTSCAARALGLIGGPGSHAPLLEAALKIDRGQVWLSRVSRQAAKDALLAVEARQGWLSCERRTDLWSGPTEPNQRRENTIGFWMLAAEERLHGDALVEALGTSEVWPRRQALAAALEQETRLEDLPILAARIGDPKLDVARVLWRYGAEAEPFLIGHLGDGRIASAEWAAESLAKIGTPRSLESLARLASALRRRSILPYRSIMAIEAVEVRSGTSQHF